MHIYHNSSSRDLILGTNETARLTIGGTGAFNFNSNNLTSIGTISSGAITSSGPITVNNVNDTYNFKAVAGDTDSWFGVYDDANNSANVIVTRSDGATSFLHLGHSGATTINGTLSSGAITSSSTIRANSWYRGGSDTNTLYSDTSQGTIIQTPSNTNNAAGTFYVRDGLGAVHFSLNTNTNAASFHGGTISSGAITSTGKVQGNSLKAHVGTDDGSQLNLFADASGHCFIAGHTLRFNTGSNNGRTTKMYLDNNGNLSVTGGITAGTAGVTTQDHRVPAGAGYITYSPSNAAGDTLTIRKYGTVQQLFDNDGVQFPSGVVRINTTNTSWVDSNDQFITNGRGVFRGYGHSALALGRYNAAASAGEAGEILAFLYGSGGIGGISITSTGTQYNTTSDLRLKNDIQSIDNATNKLMAMNPVTHGWKNNPEADTVHGFIAQEMMNIVPEAVSGDPEGEEMMSMDYGRITPVIVAALQDALKEIKELKTRINELEAK